MIVSKRYYYALLLLASVLLLLQQSSCVKEYSYEGGNQDSIPILDTIPRNDSTTTDSTDTIANLPGSILPACDLCHESDSIATGQWSFKTGNIYACGSFTNSGFIGGAQKTAFTFFGPSACSVDTGIVVTVYLPVALDQDRVDLTSSHAAFYYYDHNSTHDIFMSHQDRPFTVIVHSFNYISGIAEGSFSGIVFMANGDSTFIREGRFKAALY